MEDVTNYRDWKPLEDEKQEVLAAISAQRPKK
jgi:hypothetical protein